MRICTQLVFPWRFHRVVATICRRKEMNGAFRWVAHVVKLLMALISSFVLMLIDRASEVKNFVPGFQ